MDLNDWGIFLGIMKWAFLMGPIPSTGIIWTISCWDFPASRADENTRGQNTIQFEDLVVYNGWYKTVYLVWYIIGQYHPL